MNSAHPFAVHPWLVREPCLDLDRLAQSESVFALSNGRLGLRGNLEEAEVQALPGTYLNSFFELRPLAHAESGYGYPEQGQTVVNVTDGKGIRLLVDDAPFDVRHGVLHAHERVLDLRAGTLSRSVDWTSPAGGRLRIRSRRLVSFERRSVAAIEYVVEPVDRAVRLVVQSPLSANHGPQGEASDDPRTSTALDAPLVGVEHRADAAGAVLVHRTRGSGLTVAAASTHTVEVAGSPGVDVGVETASTDDEAAFTVSCRLGPGQRLRLVKFLALDWTDSPVHTALRDSVVAAATEARHAGFPHLADEQRAYLDDFWDRADVEIDGDPGLQQAVRFGLFHLLQSSAQAAGGCIPAKGLTGTGYDGHAFWDTEGFVLPVLTYTHPDAVAPALRWRAGALGAARQQAATLGLAGAAFPWRTIRGEECSGYWPAGTAGFHVNADIAEAVVRYVSATGDDRFEADTGLLLLVETARLWLSLGHYDRNGRWHIDGVTGPDEYSAIADDNVFTNLMASRNLVAAADAADRHPRLAAGLGVTTEEVEGWRAAARAVHIPYDTELGVHPQSEGFTRQQEWDFGSWRAGYPLLLKAPYLELYRRQVIKQADLVLAMHWCGDAFTPMEKARNFDYYERRTVRDSSLSACTQAVLAAELGHLELAHSYAAETALVDLHDLHGNSRDGLHMASMAGAWIALVAGFGGLRDHGGLLSFDPRLPEALSRLAFSVQLQGSRLRVTVTPSRVTYLLDDGADARLTFRHAGTTVELVGGRPASFALEPCPPLLPPPSQPAGRAPARRTPEQWPEAA